MRENSRATSIHFNDIYNYIYAGIGTLDPDLVGAPESEGQVFGNSPQAPGLDGKKNGVFQLL